MKVRFWHFDAALCTLFAMAGAWMFWSSRAAAADAVRRSDYNVDSGAIGYAAVVVFCCPWRFSSALLPSPGLGAGDPDATSTGLPWRRRLPLSRMTLSRRRSGDGRPCASFSVRPGPVVHQRQL